MSNNNANGSLGVCTVSDGKGNLVQVPNLLVQASDVYGFAQLYDIFEGKSLDYVLAKLIERGKAEIIRTEKTKVKTAANKAAGELLKEFNMTPAQAKAALEAAAKQIAAMSKQQTAK